MFSRVRVQRRRATLWLEHLERRDLPSLGLLPFPAGTGLSQAELLALSRQALATLPPGSLTSPTAAAISSSGITTSLLLMRPDGSWVQGQLTVDFSASYDATGQRTATAPLEIFQGLGFDGVADYTAEQADLQNSGAAWESWGNVVLQGVEERSWSSNLYGAGSFDTPVAQADESMNKSYMYTDYSMSFDDLTLLPTLQAPVARGWSRSFDGVAPYTDSAVDETYRPDAWGGLGMPVPEQCVTEAWSSDLNAEGSFDSPIVAVDGSYGRSYTVTDFTNSYTPSGEFTSIAPVARGWSWAFDGTALNPDVTNFGFAKSDLYQKFNDTIWANTGLSKLQTSYSRSYTSDLNGEGTWDSPMVQVDNSYNRSYTVTDYSGSYDLSSGQLDRSVPPNTSRSSWSYDGLGTYTRSTAEEDYDAAVLKNLGKTVLGLTKSYSWSSDANGGGTFEDPVLGPDGSLSKGSTVTDYSASFDPNTSLPTSQAPVTQGWSWSFDGTALNGQGTNPGFTKSDIYQQYNGVIWKNIGVTRLETSITRSYSSDMALEGTYDNPVADLDGSFSRSYSAIDYSQSYDLSTGRINRSAPPVVRDGYSLSYDGLRNYTRSNQTQVYNAQVWANLGKTVLFESRSISWSSDANGDGTFDDPVIAVDGSWSRSWSVTDYSSSYDPATGLPTQTAPSVQGSSYAVDGAGNVTQSTFMWVYDTIFWFNYGKLKRDQDTGVGATIAPLP
jgi:hypothetical protein